MITSLSSNTSRRVAIYIRVSTAEQRVDGYSFEAQEKKLRDYISNNSSLEVDPTKVVVFRDVHTGSDFNRVELQAMLERAKKGEFDAILVWKIDRLSRSLKHLLNIFEQLQEYKCSLISIQENIDFRGAIGNLIFQIFGAIAQFERELIKGRTQMGKLASAEQGNWTSSGTPYGYKKIPNKGGKGSKLEIVSEEKKWIQQIFQWNTHDAMGNLKIAKEMNKLKVPRGIAYKGKDKTKPWTEDAIRRIVEYNVYCGEYIANDEDDNGEILPESQWTIVYVPPIISEAVFTQARQARKLRTGGRRNAMYILSGKLVDMTIPNPQRFSGAKRTKGGHSYRRKQFDRDGIHYSVFEIPGKQIEEYIWEKILEAMKTPEKFIKRFFDKGNKSMDKIEHLEKEKNVLKEEIATLKYINIPKIEHAYENGKYSDDKFSNKLTIAETSLIKKESRMQEIDGEMQLLCSQDLEIQKLKEASEQVKYHLENLTDEYKRVLVSLFVERIEMYRVKEDGRWKIQAHPHFNFNPTPLMTHNIEGRSAKASNTNKKASSDASKSPSGGSGQI